MTEFRQVLRHGEQGYPHGARVIQAQGKTIIPALFDRDTHISQQGEAIIRYLGEHFGL